MGYTYQYIKMNILRSPKDHSKIFLSYTKCDNDSFKNGDIISYNNEIYTVLNTNYGSINCLNIISSKHISIKREDCKRIIATNDEKIDNLLKINIISVDKLLKNQVFIKHRWKENRYLPVAKNGELTF